MKKNGKKYILKESELKEIIREMVMLEAFNPDDYKGLYVNKDFAGKPTPTLSDYGKPFVGTFNTLVQNFKNSGNPLGAPAKNADAQEVFFVQKACQFLESIVNTNDGLNKMQKILNAKNADAIYVQRALNAGGLSAPWGFQIMNSAKRYPEMLTRNGWYEIDINQAGAPGDICVVLPCIDYNGNAYPNGHVSMCCNGGRWLSNYIQTTMHGLAGNPVYRNVHVYRYRNVK